MPDWKQTVVIDGMETEAVGVLEKGKRLCVKIVDNCQDLMVRLSGEVKVVLTGRGRYEVIGHVVTCPCCGHQVGPEYLGHILVEFDIK